MSILISNLTDKGNVSGVDQIIVVDFREWYQHGFEYILNGYVIPFWTVLNILIYSLMVYIFLKSGMTSKSHICLIALAVVDSLGPVWPSIMWFYVFVVRKEFYYLPYKLCRMYHYMTEVIPQVFSCASVFITIILAIQRYVAVGHPFKVERLCSKRVIKVGIFICVLTSITIKAIFFFHYDYFGITLPSREENKTMQACAVRAPKWLPTDFYEYLAMLHAVYTFVVHIIPCTVLMMFEILLVVTMKKTTAARGKMTSSTTVQSRYQKKERQITYSTLPITTLTLFFELCASFAHTCDFLYLMFDITAINNNDLRSIATAFNILYYVMVPSNFIITCCLSQEFRKQLKSTCFSIPTCIRLKDVTS